MQTWAVEIRDRGTCIPGAILAIIPRDDAELALYRKAGWHIGTGCLLIRLDTGEGHADPYDWSADTRTMRAAALWVSEAWQVYREALYQPSPFSSGMVIDVRVITGEAPEPAPAEWRAQGHGQSGETPKFSVLDDPFAPEPVAKEQRPQVAHSAAEIAAWIEQARAKYPDKRGCYADIAYDVLEAAGGRANPSAVLKELDRQTVALKGQRVTREDLTRICTLARDLIRNTPIVLEDFEDWQIQPPQKGDSVAEFVKRDGAPFMRAHPRQLMQICIEGKWLPKDSEGA